ncbi:DNA protecting protein DprA [Frankia sp. CcI49]|uniref:DNA-processing protein DprA n=1 Tax=unclassified Frankia TaxID=2632575 RepID=UPI0006CA5187|nr:MULTISPECIES: DNA-processing protein DprA [unclassified Frankia]KPM57745.1 DNA processing protein DprA [Frankia sp. R43]ONH60382.1 DNA protecting protein DprA [Frankia sp. CcI49]
MSRPSDHLSGPSPVAPVAGGEVDARRLARVGLSRIAAPARASLREQLQAVGEVALWERLRAQHPGVDPRQDIEAAERVGARPLCPGDPDWPAGLDVLDRIGGDKSGDDGMPLVLWARGTAGLADITRRAVAVVGCRAATDYGLHQAQELGFGLAERGWTIVSGAAFGVDAAAHRGALAAGGSTIAVLAGGVDVPYPAAHADLLDEIAASGLVLSETPPGSPPYRRRFLTRNRIIAALGAGTVLVEAGVRSGALNTVRHARRLGRTVMAVPGPVTSAMSAGCHRLLRDQREETALVTCAGEVCEEIGEIGELAPRPSGPTRARDGLADLVLQLLDVMPARSAIGVAALARRVDCPPGTVLALLGPLAVEGLVEATPAGYRLTALGRSSSQAGGGRAARKS